MLLEQNNIVLRFISIFAEIWSYEAGQLHMILWSTYQTLELKNKSTWCT